MPRVNGYITVNEDSFRFVGLIPVVHAEIHIIGQFRPSTVGDIPRTRASFAFDNFDSIVGPDRPIVTRDNTSYIGRTNLHIEMVPRVPGEMNLTLEAEIDNSSHVDLTSGSVEIFIR